MVSPALNVHVRLAAEGREFSSIGKRRKEAPTSGKMELAPVSGSAFGVAPLGELVSAETQNDDQQLSLD